MAKVFRANADKQLSLSKVLETSVAAFRSDKYGVDRIYADALGESRSDQRKLFMEVFATCMPHVIYNGTHKVVIVDFVEAKENSDLTKAIRQYRLAGGEIVKQEGCAGFIETEQEVKKMETVTLASGFQVEVVSRDADGNVITETKKTRLVPREKSVWGYTDVVMNALIAALEIIVDGTK